MPWALDFPAAFTTGFYQQLLKLNDAAVHRMSVGSGSAQKEAGERAPEQRPASPFYLVTSFSWKVPWEELLSQEEEEEGEEEEKDKDTE